MEEIDYKSLEEQIRALQDAGKRGYIDIGKGAIALGFDPHQNAAKIVDQARQLYENNRFDPPGLAVYEKEE